MRSIFALVAALVLSAASFQTAGAQPVNDPSNTLFLDVPAGRVVIRLRPDLAPNHVARIKELTRQGFYDGIVFHRVIAGFMAQTGDPTGTGAGGSPLPDLKAEFTQTPFKRGVIGAARTANPNSANSQFFITFADAPWLNGQYTVWGEVTSGMEFIDAIAKGEPPAKPDKIVKMRLADAPN
ncbi:MAG: peptidylprolyl isomerase [Bauldia sp.]